MRLGDQHGARVDLRIVDYQYPAKHGDGSGKDWDANWLMVAGDAVAEDGHGWSFQDPCLTTWEARSLSEWLRGVVEGSVPPTPFDNREAQHLFAFTEPNLAFSLDARTLDDAVIRVHLSLESRPPWRPEPGDPDIFNHYLLLRTPITQVALAIEDWERMINAHPAR